MREHLAYRQSQGEWPRLARIYPPCAPSTCLPFDLQALVDRMNAMDPNEWY
jgi:hypothetical protein